MVVTFARTVLLALAVLTISLSQLAATQFVPEPTDLTEKTGYAGIPVRYKQVPDGICEMTPGVQSFSGYADVGQDQHIFWYFFETRHGDPSEAPLTVWINGGPGSSSMIGLFQEHGPCMLYNNGSMVYNPYSWNNVSNMLYIDQPVGTGLSYTRPRPGYTNPNYGEQTILLPSNECPEYAQPYGTCGTYADPLITSTANSTLAAAPNVWKTLQGFMGAFPQYSRSGFHFCSESYGGHYGPVFNEYFLEQNAKDIEGAHKIQLESVTINNGWYDPIIQYQAYYNYTVSPGNPYDIDPYNATTQQELYNVLYGPGNCVDQLKLCAQTGRDDVCEQADGFCANYVENVFDVVANRDEYDARELQPDPFPYTGYIDYLNSAKVQQALGLFVNYTESSSFVGNAFSTTGDDGRESDTIEDVRKLLQANVTVTLWAGDADYNCGYQGGQKVAEVIDHGHFAKAGFVNLETDDDVVHGQVRQSGRFSFTRIYEAGHEVPFYQPLASLALFNRSIHARDIATGQETVTDRYLTHGPLTSSYREGNATVQTTVLPADSVYDRQTNAPVPQGPDSESNGDGNGTTSYASTRHAQKRLRSRRMRRGGRPGRATRASRRRMDRI